MKGCPFCGSNKVETMAVRDGRIARCRKCLSSGRPAYHGREDQPSADERAKTNWDRRYLDKWLQPIVDAARKLVYEIDQIYDVDDGIPNVGGDVMIEWEMCNRAIKKYDLAAKEQEQ